MKEAQTSHEQPVITECMTTPSRTYPSISDDERHSHMDSLSLIKQGIQGPCLNLLIVPILLMVWVYFGKQATFEQLNVSVSNRWHPDTYSAIYEYVAAFLLMFCIPALIIKMVMKQDLRDFGLQGGDVRTGIRLTSIGLPCAVLIGYLASRNPAIQAAYPLAKNMTHQLVPLLIVELCYLIYYLGWEFFFRGFMLFGLEKSVGATMAILIQTIPSTLVHIGKPASEGFAAILAGLLLGYLALRTRSIRYPVILHATAGLCLDAFLILRLP